MAGNKEEETERSPYEQGVEDERARCLAWAQWFRQHGEGDARVMVNAIRGGGHPDEEES